MQVKKILFTNVFFSLIIMLVKYVLSDGISQAFLPYLINSFSIFSVNIISLPQEVRGIFVIKAAVEMQNNLPFCD
jgi:hypothetical protein